MHTCRPLTALYPATTRNIELWAEDDDGTSMYCVATVHPLELPEDGDCEANARLFKAAAEMLAACKAARDAIDEALCVDDDVRSHGWPAELDGLRNVLETLYSAILKATGTL